jgi:2,3-diketo-5-methylthiopentyl-1-phosphate enolase
VSRSELVATYLAELPSDGTEAAAEAFATGQSIGTWLPVPGISEEMRRLHGARVVGVSRDRPAEELGGEASGDLWVLKVAFPTQNFGAQFPMMLTTLVGNDPSTSLTVRLVDIDLPEEFRAEFPGPQLGVDGWRRLTGVWDRPLLLNMIKPCTGYSPSAGADLLEQPARGGADLIKDDELLGDAPFNRVAERSRVYRERLTRVSEETGHRARYICNVTDRASRLIDTARAAVDGGADALMVNALAVGLDPFQALVESKPGVPILVHTATSDVMTGATSSGIGQALIFGKFLRLAGADAVFTTTPFARRPPPGLVYDKTLEWMREPSGTHKPTMPMLAGGVTGAMIGSLVRQSGVDVILGIGGGIQGHPQGAEAGARAVRAAIDEAMLSHEAGRHG